MIGKIDLDALNQATRPKKKSKEEQRREREERARARQQQATDKKKRLRIGKERVNISEAGKAQGAENGRDKAKGNKPKDGAKGRKEQPNNQQRKQAGKGQIGGNKHGGNEIVDDEAVARQVKETLARLTNKQTQNKKGAKYRKDRREALAEQRRAELDAENSESKVLKITEFVTVSELAA